MKKSKIMKLSKLFLATAVVTLTLTSCEKENEATENKIESTSSALELPIPSTDVAQKSNSSFYSELQSLEQLEGKWDTVKVLEDGKWKQKGPTDYNLVNLFPHSFYNGNEILEFKSDNQVDLSYYFLSKEKKFNDLPYAKIENGFSIGDKNPENSNYWEYKTYTFNFNDSEGIVVLVTNSYQNGIEKEPQWHALIKR